MNIFPNGEVPISHEDRAEIIAIFIGLMQEHDEVPFGEAGNSKLPLFDPPGSLNDLRSQWGLQ
jgi:hypothetical protein